eukprot:6206867-Pleurochrysis_carterae.AAC.2
MYRARDHTVHCASAAGSSYLVVSPLCIHSLTLLSRPIPRRCTLLLVLMLADHTCLFICAPRAAMHAFAGGACDQRRAPG